MFAARTLIMATVIALVSSSFGGIPVRAAAVGANPATAEPAARRVTAAEDPIPGILAQVNGATLAASTEALVSYGPRMVGAYQRYIDDQCTLGPTIYAKDNYTASADWVADTFRALGYSSSQITMEDNGDSGPNVVLTKVGTTYPNTYIEFGAHLDTVLSAPGANDNGAGVAALIELARVLKDYPDRYSMRFIAFADEESGFVGSRNHVVGALERGEQIKAGLIMDGIGWVGAGGPSDYRNNVWYTDGPSARLADAFDDVRSAYGIEIGYAKVHSDIGYGSDQSSYWMYGFAATGSFGGWRSGAPGHHGCDDTTANVSVTNALRAAQQNLAVGLELDLEATPPKVSITLDPATISANGTDTSLATVTVTDVSNAPLPDETVSITTDGDATVGPVANRHDGTYVATIRASRNHGDEAITATDGAVSASAVLHVVYACPGRCMTDRTTADFALGTPDAGAYRSAIDDGEVMLAPTLGQEFGGSSLPDDWTVSVYGGTPDVSVGGGRVSIDAAQVESADKYPAGQVVEVQATFAAGNAYQAVGFMNQDAFRFAVFALDPSGEHLQTDTNNASYFTLPDSLIGSPHRYRVEWTSTAERYFVDGILVHQDDIPITVPLGVDLQDYGRNGSPLRVDWVHLLPYAAAGVFTSRVFDATDAANWYAVSWTADLPAGTDLTMAVRSGDTPTPDDTWQPFAAAEDGRALALSGRYIQYRAHLATSDSTQTPLLRDVTLAYVMGGDTEPPVVSGRAPLPGATGVDPSAAVLVVFSEPMDASTVDGAAIHLRAAGSATDTPAAVVYNAGSWRATLTPARSLASLTEYAVSVAGTVCDRSGNALGVDDTWSFTTGQVTLSMTDRTTADFALGTHDAGAYRSAIDDGEVMLAPTLGQEFGGSSLPDDWTVSVYGGTPDVSVGGGRVSIDAAQVESADKYPAGQVVEVQATFAAGNAYQAVGFMNQDAFRFAVFALDPSGEHLQTDTNNASYFTLPDSLIGSPHRYRVEWTSTAERYFVDGILVHQDDIPITVPLGVDLQDYGRNGSPLRVDWVHLLPYAAAGVFTSRVFDTRRPADWHAVPSWTADLPAGTDLTMAVRSGDTPTPDDTWQPFAAAEDGRALALSGRYIQYRAHLATSDGGITPVLDDVSLSLSLSLPGNRPPLLTNPGDQTSLAGDSVHLVVAAQDADGDQLAFGADGLPSGLSIDSQTGAINGAIGSDAVAHGPYDVTVNVSDGIAPPVTASFTWTVAAVPTTTTVESSANPSAYGDPVTFTAAVVPVSGVGTSVGSVQFGIDGTAHGDAVDLVGGSASLVVSHLAVGTHIISATYSGDNTFGGSASDVLNQEVARGSQAISFTSIPPSGAVVGGTPYSVTATGGVSGNSVMFSVDPSSASVCSVNGSAVSFIGAGICTIRADQPGTDSYEPAPSVSQSFDVDQASPVISWSAPAPITYGTPLGDAQLAAGSGGLAGHFAYDPPAGAVLHAGPSQQLSVTFTPDDANYAPVTSRVGIEVLRAPLTVTATDASRPYGQPNPPLGATYSGFVNREDATVLAGSPACTTGATAASPVGEYAITCVAGNLAAADYSFSFAAGRLTVFPVSQAITFGGLLNKIYGDPPFSVSATSSSGLAVTFTTETGTVCSVTPVGVVTIVGAGSCTIIASQPGDANWLAATPVSRALTVNKATSISHPRVQREPIDLWSVGDPHRHRQLVGRRPPAA